MHPLEMMAECSPKKKNVNQISLIAISNHKASYRTNVENYGVIEQIRLVAINDP